MRLLSDELLKDLPSRKEVSLNPQSEIYLHFHLYNPLGPGEWFVIAKDYVEDDVDLIVLEMLDVASFMKFSLKHISQFKFPCGERIKRDKFFMGMTLGEFGLRLAD